MQRQTLVWDGRCCAHTCQGPNRIEGCEKCGALGVHLLACAHIPPPHPHLLLHTFSHTLPHFHVFAGVDLYLYHWCAVQRIAARSRVLSQHRTQQLTDLGFDWTGADPLS